MKRKVLLADDEEMVRALVEATFANDGSVEIRTACDGDEALSVARQWRPDLVFLDVMMPGLDGWEVCQALKEDLLTRNARVVMLTGLSDEFDREKARAVGADDYITKPFSPVDLFRKFEDLLLHL